jgi:hypothetical protein
MYKIFKNTFSKQIRVNMENYRKGGSSVSGRNSLIGNSKNNVLESKTNLTANVELWKLLDEYKNHE